MAFLDFLNPLSAITDLITKAYTAKLDADNDKDRIRLEGHIAELEAKRDAVIAASVNDKWWSPRTVMGWSAAAYVFKIIVWDTVLGWGVTPNPGEQVTFIVMTIVGFYFVSKGAETIANTIAGAIARRGVK